MSVTKPTHSYDFRVASTTSVSDQMGSGGTATYQGNAVSTTADGVVLDNSDNINGPKYVSITPPTISDSTHSIEIYFKLTTDIEAYAMITSFNSTSGSIERWISTTGNSDNRFQNNNATSSTGLTTLYSDTNPTAGTLYHAVLTFEKNGNTAFYINNATTGTSSTSTMTTFSYTTGSWELGRRTNSATNYADITVHYVRWWNGYALSASDVASLYTHREANYFNFTNMRINYGDVYLAQTLNKTLDDYKAENISLHDISFGAFPSANKYKQSYAKTLLDLSGDFVHRKHTFIGDISFNNDLSINNVMVLNNDLSLNTGLIVNGDASFNGNVNVTGDVSLNGNLKLKDKSIETSKLNFTIIANEGTFDSTKDVSLNSTFTVQGDFDKYIDISGNFQTDFSENVVLIPSSLGLDLSGGSATLSGKTGDQAFLNGTYIVNDNSGNTTGNIYDDLHENTAENKLTSLPKNWNSLQVNSRGNWVYDGSSNYTTYLDEYGRPQTVKGDNYDLTLPFHFYPSKAFLRTIPILPASSSINPHNYPASVKFLGSSVDNKYHLLGEFSNKAIAVTADSSLNYTYNSVVTNTSGNYVHGADFLYDLNRKYYINQLRMIVDQAPDSSGNSYGQYSIDRLAYSGSSFSGKKLENNYPNLYLNTAAHDISYGFTENHTNIVYDLSHNKNQLPIIDMSGGGGIHIAPREISIQDGSLNTINIHKPIIKNTYSKPTYAENTYSIVAPATDASFNTEFYSHFGARDASGHFNKRISQDGKTIVTLQNRGTQAYDVSNAEVVFSTDYGKNWKNILRDCSDSFLFTEHDISYGLLFATGDVSGAIDIATSSNGQTMYVGRHRHFFKTENDYSGLGYVPAQEITIPSITAINNHTDPSVADLRYFPQSFVGNNTGTGSITVSGLTGDAAAFNGSWSATMSSGITSTNYKNGLWGLMDTNTVSGQYAHNIPTSIQYDGFTSNKPTISYNGGSVTAHYMLLEFPAYVKFSKWVLWTDDRFFSGSFIGTDENGVNQLLGTWAHGNYNGQLIINNSINGANNTYVNKLYLMFSESALSWAYLTPMWFEGTYKVPGANGIPIPTTGVPEIYSTNYGNSWKLSPFKYHKGPTIISGDGSTILILQESKLDNAKHEYATISGHGNNNPYVDTHWITTDYGSNWNTLNRSGYDISNNVIPPSYGSKTATFLKACMSYTGQYIYIYNVQCTTNNNYGELYYSHDYGNTWNKWTTVEAQNYVASGNTLAGSGQILCSGNGKYVFIAGQTASSSRLSQAIYYRSTDYGVTFNKDITTFPWQEGSSGEDSTSRGPFISYEGDLIVISNTHYKYIDDSDATISYGSSQYSGLKYSLDYGVNYNVLDLSGESLSNATTNFSTLPNKTNKNFSSIFSTKGDIFSNCPGPNDYSFLTTVMGGNTTDASFVFLQSIEFPKDKISTTVEKEGPVITTYEEPIDTENDFGNITNTTTLTSGVSYYSSAISEDGQVLLTAGATDISNGSYYGGYNLTNAKFPPTENVVVPTSNALPHFKTANLSYDGNQALLVPYGITQTNAQNLYYWSASGDFHRFDGNYMSNFDAENWKFGKLSGNGNFFVGFTHSSSTLSDASYNSATWWQDKVSNTMIIYKNLYTMPRGTVGDSDATTRGQGTTYDLNTAFSTDSGVTEYYITSVHVSETGQYVLFVGGSSDTTLTNRCAFSKDYGTTFTNITSLFSFTDITKPLVYCHVSDNGRYLFISQYNSSEYCFSTDYGASFSLHNTFPSSTKTYGVVSKDGQNALFVDTNKYVYVSVNGNFRQEVIPSLSGTNTNLSLNHNYWKYKTTLTNNLYYNPSMPNIKYLIGTLTTLTAVTHSSVRYTESYFSELDIKGSLTNLSGTAYTSSDYRVKENVRDLEDSDSIASLTPISYTQNNLHHKKSIGFLAHEFAESFPDLVDGTKDGPEMQSINYNGIIAVLIKEIQTLRAKINKLKSEI